MQQLQALAYLWRGLLGLQYKVNILNAVHPYGNVNGPACAGPEDALRAELMGMGSWLATTLGVADLAAVPRALSASPISRMTAGDLYAEIGAAKRLYFNAANPVPSSYLLSEDFENGGWNEPGWITYVAGGGALDTNVTVIPLEGVASASFSGAGVGPQAIATSPQFDPQSDLSVFFLLRPDVLATSVIANTYAALPNANAILSVNLAGRLGVQVIGEGAVYTVDAMVAGTTYQIWVRIRQSVGGVAGLFSAEFNVAGNPLGSGNAYVQQASLFNTTPVIRFGLEASTDTFAMTLDHIRVSGAPFSTVPT
jgi:hypothetical protein